MNFQLYYAFFCNSRILWTERVFINSVFFILLVETPPPAYSPSDEKDSVTSTQRDSTPIDSPMADVCSIPYQVRAMRTTRVIRLGKTYALRFSPSIQLHY